VAQHATARHEALQALKLGDQAGALAKLRASVRKGARAPAEDTQVVGDLCSIAHQLAGEQHAAARSAAALAVSEANKARGQLPRREAAYVAAQAGFVLESVVGDGAAAASLYNSALSLDGARKDATEGLQRIARLQVLAQAKAQENAVLVGGGK
jgi:hypothetical protein